MQKIYLRMSMMAVLVLCFSIMFTVQAHGDVYKPTPCPYTGAPHYNPNLAVTVSGEQIQLLDTSSSTVLYVLEDDVLDFYHHNLYWGLNCRYFFANDIVQPLEKSYVRFTNIYDLTTGTRIFRTRRDPFFVQLWSPSRQQFIIKSVTGTFFMSEALSQPLFLFKHNASERSMLRFQWDTDHNQLLVIFAGNAGYLNIYDMNSGATLAAISNPQGCRAPINYNISDDQRYFIVFTGANYAGNPSCISIYDRTTGAQQSVNAGALTVTRNSQIALSPDGRYLVTGILALRVWDLANLPANFADRIPIHRYEGPFDAIESVRFVDATTVETTSSDGTQRWNVLTGDRISP